VLIRFAVHKYCRGLEKQIQSQEKELEECKRELALMRQRWIDHNTQQLMSAHTQHQATSILPSPTPGAATSSVFGQQTQQTQESGTLPIGVNPAGGGSSNRGRGGLGVMSGGPPVSPSATSISSSSSASSLPRVGGGGGAGAGAGASLGINNILNNNNNYAEPSVAGGVGCGVCGGMSKGARSRSGVDRATGTGAGSAGSRNINVHITSGLGPSVRFPSATASAATGLGPSVVQPTTTFASAGAVTGADVGAGIGAGAGVGASNLNAMDFDFDNSNSSNSTTIDELEDVMLALGAGGPRTHSMGNAAVSSTYIGVDPRSTRTMSAINNAGLSAAALLNESSSSSGSSTGSSSNNSSVASATAIENRLRTLVSAAVASPMKRFSSY
jgi:hypothetical protein